MAGPGDRARRAAARDERLAHNSVLFRQPITTLDDHLARGLRVEALGEMVERFEPGDDDDDALARCGRPGFRAADSPAHQPARLLRLRAPRGDDVEAPRHAVPEAWYRLPIFYFSNVSEIRGPGDPVWAPRGSKELDYELEIARADRHAGAATCRRRAARRRSAATWS